LIIIYLFCFILLYYILFYFFIFIFYHFYFYFLTSFKLEMSRRSARLSKKQNDLFKDLLFTLTPGVANSSNTESKITKQGGKVQRIYTKKVYIYIYIYIYFFFF